MERAKIKKLQGNGDHHIIIELESTFAAVTETIKEIDLFLEKNLEAFCINLWCFQEMLANAVEHGNRFHPDKKVVVEVKAIHNYISFTITDQGDGFDWKSYINRKGCLLTNSERGRGIVMSNMLCSRLTYNDKGNQVVIIYDFKNDRQSFV